ncbi:DNA topoisomerase 4 subunit A [Vibrio coralliirubri]|uniref:DNA topoisomerase (ATP-hydrolyzing) n=1 Tax=Vibrio coralliirubri TaxID=1516159 RepID=UPI002285256F|nr:DNA topoisomerase (ATP-hydrolyzing) [Vibrio coralliirubri]MCY9866112.1 DNA topoisomerase 4 subunit A [Vibrio coralliirubri]
MTPNNKISIDSGQFIQLQESSYLAYAALTLAGRSLPHIQDGLKPVHRRILYAMNQLNMTNKGGHKKSARVVGDVIGKYHPHGDSAVYEAMVGLAQTWNCRYPLVDGQGNWGSRDGDGAAAMRYTETKPSEHADFMLKEIAKSAARYKKNFDDTTVEPEYLPVPFPNILCNGGDGIGVGMKTYLPPHNISEVCAATEFLIQNPDCSISDLMQFIKAPDYATGGQITNTRQELQNIYETGKGTLRIRATWEVEKRARGQYVIIVNELPNKMSTTSVLTTIDDILMYEPSREKTKDGKEPKVNQIKLDMKSFLKAHVEAVTDISDTKDDPKQAKLMIVPRTCSRTPEEFMEALIPVIDLELKVPCEFNLMSIDYIPRRRTLKDILVDWVEYRRQTMTRRCEARKGKVEARLEIIAGRLTIMDHIDDVIAIIRDAEDPKFELIERFKLTERQADDIMDIKLRELRRLEETKLVDEQSKLEKELKSLIGLLGSKAKMGKLLIKEMNDAASALADERRTIIDEQGELKFDNKFKASNSDPVTLFITDQGWLMSRKGHDSEAPEKMLKPEDFFVHSINSVMSDDLIVLSGSGRSYTLAADQFPNGASSSHINTLVNISTDKVIAAFPYNEKDRYLLCQSYGLGFVVKSASLHSRQKNGKEVFRLDKFDNAEILLVHKLTTEDINGEENTGYVGHLNIHTSTNRFMSFDLSKPENMINDYPKSQGLQLCKLSKKDRELVAFYAISSGEFVNADGVVALDVDTYTKKRAGTPVKVK